MQGEAMSSAKLQDSNNGSSSSKRKNENEDRISSLPDEVLCHILSFLPTKYAFRTGNLSTRWRYLWTSVPVLHFDENLIGSRGGRERLFMNFVDRVLFFNVVHPIQKFSLKFFGFCDLSRVCAWISTAIMRNVLELELDLGIFTEDAVQLPRSLFSCEKLKILKLHDCSIDGNVILNFPDSVSLPSLKVLHLRSLQCLNDANMRKLLSGAPVLEQLEIERNELDDMWTLYVNSCSLKSLTIQNFGDYNDIDENQHYKVVVDAPNLEFLEVTDYMSEELKITRSSKIVKAQINVLGGICGEELYVYANMVVQLLRQISNVKVLCLTGEMLMTLNEGTQERLAALQNLVTFCNLTHLELTAPCEPLISLDILACTPNLEVLVLEMDDTVWEPLETVPECFLSSLKMVQIKNFAASELDMEIVECILKNAMVLEKMTLSYYQCLAVIDPDVHKKLFTLPRASSSCQILFTEPKAFS